MRKKLLVTLFAVAAFAGMSYVSAIADSRKGCEKRGGSCATLPAGIKLTKEQKAKFDEVNLDCEKAGAKIHADIKVARLDLNALLKKDPIDKAAVDAKVDELADLIKKAIKNKTDCKVKVLSILDAEQKKVYIESLGDCCGEGGYGCEKGRHACETKGKKPCEMKGMGSPEKM